MEVWIMVSSLILIIFGLCVKIYLLRKSAEEIRVSLAEKLRTETNTKIDIASRDRCMRQLADSLNEQLHILCAERHRFQRGDRELKEAVTNISHDLRTPLTAICGYLDLLESEEKSEAAVRYLEVIRNRSEVMKQLTEELFCYAVVTAPSGELPCEDVILNHVLEESILDYYAVFREHGITPEIHMTEEDVVRRLNKNAISRILDNVLSNAVKYSDGDLKILLSEEGEMAFMNHASGLDEVQVGRLFDRFYTVEDAVHSTGLGLSIAKVLTDQMGGRIGARYDQGQIRVWIKF